MLGSIRFIIIAKTSLIWEPVMITELIYKFLFLSSCLTHTLNASQPDSFFTADCKRDKKVKGERFINYACFVALIIIFIITKAHTRILCYTEMILGGGLTLGHWRFRPYSHPL